MKDLFWYNHFMAKLVSGINDLKSLYPLLAAEYSKDNIQPLESVFAKSNKKYVWDGPCGHSWTDSPNHRTSGRGCPICSGRQLLVGFNDFATKKPELAKHFSASSKNSPNEILASSTKEITVACPRCGDERNMAAYKLTSPFCRGCGQKRAKIKYERSLAALRPEIATLVSKKSPYTASEVSEFSVKKLLWDCQAGHTYPMAVNNKTFGNQGCPVCNNQMVISGINDFKTLYPDLAAIVSPNSLIRPETVGATGNKKLLFECESDHQWEAGVKNVVKGSRCGRCSYISGASKGEKELANFIESAGYKIIRNDRVALSGLEIDVYLPEFNLGIEYNGDYWHKTEKGMVRDRKKKAMAKAKEIKLIYVWESKWKESQGKEQDRVLRNLEKYSHLDVPKVSLYSQNTRSIEDLERFFNDELKLKEGVDYFTKVHGVDFYFPTKKFSVQMPTIKNSFTAYDTAIRLQGDGVEVHAILPWHSWTKTLEMLSHRFMNSKRIYGRKTKCHYLEKRNGSSLLASKLTNFIGENHILGLRRADADYFTWLVYEGEIVAAAAWAKKRSFRNKKPSSTEDIELVRLAFKAGVAISGGASKLLSNFVRKYEEKNKLKRILTFSDFDLGSGNVYKALGFNTVENPKRQKNFLHEKITNLHNGEALPLRIKNTSLVFAGADRLLAKFPNYKKVGMECNCAQVSHKNRECLPTNQEIALSYGFKEFYDCGYKKWILTFEPH